MGFETLALTIGLLALGFAGIAILVHIEVVTSSFSSSFCSNTILKNYKLVGPPSLVTLGNNCLLTFLDLFDPAYGSRVTCPRFSLARLDIS